MDLVFWVVLVGWIVSAILFVWDIWKNDGDNSGLFIMLMWVTNVVLLSIAFIFN